MKRIPPPPIAVSYYMGEDLYKYDEFQTEREPGTTRIVVKNLYDVFAAISGDEAEHAYTESGTVDAIIDVLTRILPFLSG
eukprot:scaffold170838_cov42-Prasinocladus_malaysianus.AAC.1